MKFEDDISLSLILLINLTAWIHWSQVIVLGAFTYLSIVVILVGVLLNPKHNFIMKNIYQIKGNILA